MSIRTSSTDDSYASAVRKDLSALKATALEASRLDNLDTTVRPQGQEAAAAYDSLAPHEQAAASLGVSPNELKPCAAAPAQSSPSSHERAIAHSPPFPRQDRVHERR